MDLRLAVVTLLVISCQVQHCYSACTYKGVPYSTGQRWSDGCEYDCVCEDEEIGVYKCYERCASYDAGIPAGCTLVTDPNDQCCKVPNCPTPAPGIFKAPRNIPTEAPGRTDDPKTTALPAPVTTNK